MPYFFPDEDSVADTAPGPINHADASGDILPDCFAKFLSKRRMDSHAQENFSSVTISVTPKKSRQVLDPTSTEKSRESLEGAATITPLRAKISSPAQEVANVDAPVQNDSIGIAEVTAQQVPNSDSHATSCKPRRHKSKTRVLNHPVAQQQVAPIQPTVKNRKAAALAARAALPKPGPGGKPTGGNGGAGKQRAAVEDGSVVGRPSMSVSSGVEYRVELVAYNEENTRVYIFGSTSKRYGSNLRSHAESTKKFIMDTPGVTKSKALEHLRSLQAK